MIILATDLDRTLLPNGTESYDGTLPELFRLVRKYEMMLIYVSGRNLSMLKDAQKEFGIELPDYFIGEVGTMVYKRFEGELTVHPEWESYLRQSAPEWDKEKIEQLLLKEIPSLVLQEDEKQNKFKLSFYIHDTLHAEEYVEKVHSCVSKFEGVEVVYSTDPLMKDIGLLDILPKSATKLSALEFVREFVGAEKQDIIYAGDSGNDILPLTGGYRGILVRNASRDTLTTVNKHHADNKTDALIYQAVGDEVHNGNYSSGIIEGLVHFKVVEDEH
ncbi:MAG: HAD-IIB family hydrolase [Candidatus Paceibacterota bacterium]